MTGKHRTAKRQLFPEKLWDLVNKPNSGVQWSPDGKRIEVERTQLEKFIGTKFRSHNFDSFIRQLHFYGFRKSGNSYHHDKFQRGQPEALLTMKRKYSNFGMIHLLPVGSNSPCYTSNASNTSSTDSSGSIGPESRSYSADIINNNDIIDQSTIVNTNEAAMSSTCVEEENECALDYSSNSKLIIAQNNANKSTGKSLTKFRGHEDNSLKDITLYSLKSNDSKKSISPNTSVVNSYNNIREDVTKIDRSDKNSLKITIPELLNDTNNSAWPQTLVFENYWTGTRNILSAYFIYRTNESHKNQ